MCCGEYCVASSIHRKVHYIMCSRAPSPVTVTSLLLTSLTSTRRVRHYFSPSFLPNTPLLAASSWSRHHQHAAKDSLQREEGQRCRLRAPTARTAYPQVALHTHKGSGQLEDTNSIRSHVHVSIHPSTELSHRDCTPIAAVVRVVAARPPTAASLNERAILSTSPKSTARSILRPLRLSTAKAALLFGQRERWRCGFRSVCSRSTRPSTGPCYRTTSTTSTACPRINVQSPAHGN
jgi:hypothetical protein